MSKRAHPVAGRLAAVLYPLVRSLPTKVASELLALIVGRLARLSMKTDKIRRNLRVAFPDRGDAALDAMTRRIAANFGRQVAEIVHMRSFASGKWGTRIEACGAPEQSLEQDRPAIYVSAHLGNWELIPILFQRHGVPLTIVYTDLAFPGVNRKLLALRRSTGATYVEKANALRACVKALARGESIALLVDQRVESGIEVEFFGRPTLFTHLPARMALRFGCPIAVCEAVRVAPGHVRTVFHAPIRPEEAAGEDGERALTQRMAEVIEGCIRRHPEEWFCNKRRWKPAKSPDAAHQSGPPASRLSTA